MCSQQLNSKAAGSGATDKPARKNDLVCEIWLLTIIVAMTILCYSPVLFNFFSGDDFVHLIWLSQAVHQPELVLRNFYSSWLDGTTTKFYRPLISVFMLSDYAIWGANGLGFRLTNLLFHLSSTIWIFLIGKYLLANQAQASSETPNKQAENSLSAYTSASPSCAWPAAAAALFALYPIHPEAVSWITGRVDSVVTAFCLGAVFFYLRYSQSARPLFLSLSLTASALGLMSKEMAITLPAVFTLYELAYMDAWSKSDSLSSLAQALYKIWLRTMPFWLLLLAYFSLRYIALGTLVGGYDNNLFLISTPKEFLAGWLHSLGMLLQPINKLILAHDHFLRQAWSIVIFFCVAFALLNVTIEPKNRRHFLFLAGWFLLCLVPVYKLFNISIDLQGSRLAYLSSAPLCMLLTCALLPSHKLKKFATAFKLLMPTSCLLAGALLWLNNLPWQRAGIESNAIRSSLEILYKNIHGDPQVLLLGLPDQIEGAYTCRNSLDGMTKKPQLDRNINNCLMVNAFEPIIPFGYLKDSIAENMDKILVYYWDSTAKKLNKINIDPSTKNSGKIEWQKGRLNECISHIEQNSKSEVAWQADGTLCVNSPGSQEEFLELNLGNRSCFATDFVEIDLCLAKPAAADSSAELFYSNDMYPFFDLKRRIRAHFAPGKQDQRLIFALRGLPEWSFGGKTHKFRFLIPAKSKLTVTAITLLPKQNVIPQLNFNNSGYFGSKGFIHLSSTQREAKLSVDVGKVAGAAKFALEITRTNLLFEEQNTQARSNVQETFKVYDQSKDELVLKYADFKSVGLYELRIFPLDKNGNICGAASDHLVISLDK